MSSLLRCTLLAICLAAGTGLAIGIAVQLEGPARNNPEVPPLQPIAPPENAAQLPAPQPALAQPALPPGMQFLISTAPPAAASHSPMEQAVSRQLERLQDTIDRAEDINRRNQRAVDDALSAMARAAVPTTWPQRPAEYAHTAPAEVPKSSARIVEAEREPKEVAAPRGELPVVTVSRRQPGLAEPLPPPGVLERVTINTKKSDIREVLELLGEAGGLNILASENVTGAVQAKLTDVDVNTALDAILRSTGFVAKREGDFIYIGTPADLEAMQQRADAITTRVYRPNYVTAAELQGLITPLLTESIGKVTVSSPSEVDIPADGNRTGGDNFGGQEVLLVRDYAAVLAQVDQVVAEVDVRPRQVSIEAMILKVDLDDENRFGIDFELLRDQNNVRIISGNPLASLAAIKTDAGGLHVGFLNSNIALFLEAIEKIADANVIAKPRVMCLNKQRAEILIGRQDGYVSTTVTESAATQSVEFLESGTQLRIRPFISADGMIRMEIHPELSDGSVTVDQGFTLPTKEVTQVTTNVMCRDGCTLVLGGLIHEELENSTTQIPVLGSLPYIGPGFRQKVEKIARTELIVLITPRIVYEPEANIEGYGTGLAFHQRQANYFDKMSPIGKRHYGLQYLRKARAAWLAGDADVALRYVNLSIQFDPASLDATALREEIAQAAPRADHKVNIHLREGLAPWQHPVREYSRQGYPFLGPLLPPPGNEGMYDPGVPGRTRNLEPGGMDYSLEPLPLPAGEPAPGEMPLPPSAPNRSAQAPLPEPIR